MRNRVRKDLRIKLFGTDEESKLSCKQLNLVEEIIRVFEFHLKYFEMSDTAKDSTRQESCITSAIIH